MHFLPDAATCTCLCCLLADERLTMTINCKRVDMPGIFLNFKIRHNAPNNPKLLLEFNLEMSRFIKVLP